MTGVDLGDHQRYVGVHPMRPGVGHHPQAALREGLLDGLRHIGVQGGERDAAGERRGGAGDGHPRDPLGQRRGFAPADDLAVGPPGALVRGRERADLEPGVVGQNPHEFLPDRAGGTQHGDGDFRLHVVSSASRSVASFM